MMSPDEIENDGKTWSEIVAPIARQLKLASMFNGRMVYNAEGAAAIAKLMTGMASKLDGAVVDMQRQIELIKELERTINGTCEPIHNQLVPAPKMKDVTPMVTRRPKRALTFFTTTDVVCIASIVVFIVACWLGTR